MQVWIACLDLLYQWAECRWRRDTQLTFRQGHNRERHEHIAAHEVVELGDSQALLLLQIDQISARILRRHL